MLILLVFNHCNVRTDVYFVQVKKISLKCFSLKKSKNILVGKLIQVLS